jgi:hypothetical protein
MLVGCLVLNILLVYLAWRHYKWDEIIKESQARSMQENEMLDMK